MIALPAALLTLLSLAAGTQDPEKIVKDRSSLLRTALKPFVTFVGVDRAKGEVLLRMEDGKTWAVDADAEIRVHGWWGGLEDLVQGDRLWIWVRLDRESKPRAIFMIADEISEQDIHQVPYTLSSVDVEKREVVVRRKLDGKTEQVRTLKVHASLKISDPLFKPEGSVYLQTSGDVLTRIAGADELAALKEAQKEKLEGRLRRNGLPGTVAAMHGLVGEIDVTLDHEAMRWARSLKPGDPVKINLEKPVQAAVLEVRPWNERTRVTLAASGRDLADLAVGQRIRLGVPGPTTLASRLPPDAGRPREAGARAEWFLASTYCSCSISGDVCTGMFYTLAACNSMKCGMPKTVRGFVGPLIEKGMTDPEIFERMEREFGPAIWKPHLLR